jgi:molybdopterin/thiamine biosynthesis adenylyltransferase
MDSQYKECFCRNIGLLSEPEQERLSNSCIGIAGVGGVGGLLAERLIRLGVGQLKITDPGAFEKSNLNRQYGSSLENLGQNKAQEVFEQLKRINPQAKILWSEEGIRSQNNAIQFLNECDLVIDEMDISTFKESIFLQRAARRLGMYYLFSSAMGFGALTVVFDPEGITLEEYNGLDPGLNLSNIEKLMLPVDRVTPVIPSYVTDIAKSANIQEILMGEKPAPTVSLGVGLASILVGNEAIRIILNKGDIVKAPQFIYVDLFDRVFKVGTCGK